jgi:hypothetical protein
LSGLTLCAELVDRLGNSFLPRAGFAHTFGAVIRMLLDRVATISELSRWNVHSDPPARLVVNDGLMSASISLGVLARGEGA